MKLTSRNGRMSCIGCLIALPWLFLVVLMAGCPQPGNGNGNNNGNDNTGSGRGQIVTPSSSFGISLLDPPFQVRYNVPTDATNISGYRFAVADSSINSPAIGDDVTIATGLQAGSNRFFDFDPSEAGVGYHRVGIAFTLDGDSDLAESSGVIQVQGPPSPQFILPAQSLTVVPEGDTVSVTFDARDPEGQVQWRLFYLDSDDSLTAPADRIGTQLATGSGNVGTFSFRTTGLAAGDYTLGISATDSGSSVAATVAAGQLDRVVTIPGGGVETPVIRVVPEGTIVTPTITITNPGNSDIDLYKDETFTIRFTADVPQQGVTGSVEVFYDIDTNVNNGFTIIADDLTDSDTRVPFPTGVPEGTYFIGATIRDGISTPVTDYSAGRVIVTRTITLEVTEPNTTLAVAPDTSVAIRWTTNAPDDSGTVDVFAQRLNALNQPTGAVIPIITAGAMTLRTATFTSATTGLFQITVRLNITGEPAVSDTSPRPVRISTLPAIAWLGSIAEPDPALDGAIFGGVNFEDNAGSAFAKADDFDGDGLNEFVIAARYAKPFFVNPSGIGIGEAYLLYGERGTSRLQGEYNLNSVGSASLRGITLTGIRTNDNPGVTEGLSEVLAIPDADGDGVGELAFGFPKVSSRDLEYPRPNSGLDRPDQFLGGGVVILSSENPGLDDPTTGSTVINLDLVGQQFEDTVIDPQAIAQALFDQFRFEPGDPTVDPPTEDSCILGTDSVVDTVRGPMVGFVDFDLDPCPNINGCQPARNSSRIGLAPAQAWALFQDGTPNVVRFFRPFDSPPELLVCPTRTDPHILNICSGGALNVFSGINAGSGFYPRASNPEPPFGARIVGRNIDDRFGTTMTFNEGTGINGSAELIFSAPKRSAQPLLPNGSGEVVGISVPVQDSGVAYITRNRNFWGLDEVIDGVPPKPHQYIMNRASHCSTTDRRAEPIFYDPTIGTLPGGYNRPEAGAIKIAGDVGDEIQNLLGIDDFNEDGIEDLAIGAPQAGGGNGRVYIAYRRQGGSSGLEGDFVLSKLQLPPDDSDRLDGLLISTTSQDALGSSLAGGFDFNGDGISDLVLGSPDAGGGTGEVIILFGGTGIVSPAGGLDVQTLLTQRRTADGDPVAVRIRGATMGGEKGLFGFNVANAGDVDGDGLDDLLIAAPAASPRFDADPNDGVDALTTLGIDLDLNGIRDEVPGDDQLLQAGLVYVILGKNRLDQVRTCHNTTTVCTTAADCSAGVACTLTDPTISIDQLGTSRLSGLIIVGRRAGDRLGGGDASDPNQGGIGTKQFGRSRGLASAGDVDGDGLDDILIGAIVADPRRDPNTGTGVRNGGEAYLIYGSNVP